MNWWEAAGHFVFVIAFLCCGFLWGCWFADRARYGTRAGAIARIIVTLAAAFDAFIWIARDALHF